MITQKPSFMQKSSNHGDVFKFSRNLLSGQQKIFFMYEMAKSYNQNLSFGSNPIKNELNEKSMLMKKKMLRFCGLLKRGCDCLPEEGFKSSCAVSQKMLRRINEVNRRLNRPRLLIIRIKNSTKLSVEVKANRKLDMTTYESMLEPLLFKKKPAMDISQVEVNESILIQENRPVEKKNPSKIMTYLPYFLKDISSKDFKASSFVDSLIWKNNGSVLNESEINMSKKNNDDVAESIIMENVFSKEVKKPTINSNRFKNNFFVELDEEKDSKLIERSKSSIKISSIRRTNVETIKKDVIRTFQSDKYFRNQPVLKVLQTILEDMADNNQEIGYVQGMNFIIGSIVYHCTHYLHSTMILDFLFEYLEMRKVFNFTTLDTYLEVAKGLMKCHLLEFYSYFDKVIKIDFKMLLLDWFFCLGFNKVPLNYSHLLLQNLVRYGWFFFYRLLINYFRLFSEKRSKRFLSAKNLQEKFELQIELKNFYKLKIDWEELLNLSTESFLMDSVIEDVLGWTYINMFQKPIEKKRNLFN